MENWGKAYQSAIRHLGDGKIDNAFKQAIECRNMLQQGFLQETLPEKKIEYLDRYLKTLLLFFDCSLKKGHAGCAITHLEHGFKSVSLLLRNDKESTLIRQKARDLLKHLYEEMANYYLGLGVNSDLMLLQQRFRRDYFFKYLIHQE